MRKFFKRIISAIQLKLRKNKMQLSAKGECFILYILNKYINGEEVASVAAYEEIIDKSEQKALQDPFFSSFLKSLNNDEYQEGLHQAGALLQFIMLLYTIREPEQYYLQIKNNNLKLVIQDMVKHVI